MNTAAGCLSVRHPHRESPELFTIAQVSRACGLPAGVIMQLVPRTWTPAGWMYTAAQRAAATDIAADLRR
jgi:hypothetical protein